MNHLDESSLGLNENPYIIQLQNLTKVYDGVTVIDKRNMNIKKGEFVTILGPSGCGKSTTLRRIAGFETPDSGDILLNISLRFRLTNVLSTLFSSIMHCSQISMSTIMLPLAYGTKRFQGKSKIRTVTQSLRLTKLRSVT